MALSLLPTTVVGSYPQPDWLIDRARLSKLVPRVRMKDLWRIPESNLREAQDDATVVAIRDMERAGIDIISDGEQRRESYSNHFATALEGVDTEQPGRIVDRYGKETLVPRVVGAIRRRRAVEVEDMAFLRRHTDRLTKITLPGPFTMSQQSVDEHYRDGEAMAMAFAAAVNEEARELQAAGADVIQIDEPWLRNDPRAADRYAIKAINRAFEGITVTTAVHLCFGYAAVVRHEKPAGYAYLAQLASCVAQQISIEAAQPKVDLSVLEQLPTKTIILGVIDLGDPEVESPRTVADRIRAGLEHVDPERLIAAPDCGMKYLPRATAFGKLAALAEGAAIVRRELG
ncbi:MAG: 5-methyltetrahydropteroyltriglutamate--homocysteine methyltransferase [Ectothiorhodospiraceae bacterium]|nr:5-methyltetrahydropteroyltriglutamate--homocysteine methyltransferase [Chromatiales bacterium]MCP5154522.1 5-methyltetrahydropteroyltriglutamate--homocysteine methyltransferase [Ectothiorhodospiraceae bacterium]